jgi:hypothetical protein
MLFATCWRRGIEDASDLTKYQRAWNYRAERTVSAQQAVPRLRGPRPHPLSRPFLFRRITRPDCDRRHATITPWRVYVLPVLGRSTVALERFFLPLSPAQRWAFLSCYVRAGGVLVAEPSLPRRRVVPSQVFCRLSPLYPAKRKMAPKPKQPAGPPMDLRNMRHLGVRGLAVHCLNPKCWHRAVFSADDYPDEVSVPSFQARMKCGKCGAKGDKSTCGQTGRSSRVQMSMTGKQSR